MSYGQPMTGLCVPETSTDRRSIDDHGRGNDTEGAGESRCRESDSAGMETFEILDAGGDIAVLGIDSEDLRVELERFPLLPALREKFGQVVAQTQHRVLVASGGGLETAPVPFDREATHSFLPETETEHARAVHEEAFVLGG